MREIRRAGAKRNLCFKGLAEGCGIFIEVKVYWCDLLCCKKIISVIVCC